MAHQHKWFFLDVSHPEAKPTQRPQSMAIEPGPVYFRWICECGAFKDVKAFEVKDNSNG